MKYKVRVLLQGHHEGKFFDYALLYYGVKREDAPVTFEQQARGGYSDELVIRMFVSEMARIEFPGDIVHDVRVIPEGRFILQ